MEEFNQSSFLFGANSVFIEELYSKYLQDPNSVDNSWQELFSKLPDAKELALKVSEGASWAPRATKIIGVQDKEIIKEIDKKQPIAENTAIIDAVRAQMLIRAYRYRGHLLADIDPLKIDKPKAPHEISLDPAQFGFTEADYERPIFVGAGDLVGVETVTLRELIAHLQSIYSAHIGAEFMYIEDLGQKEWIQNKLESSIYDTPLSNEKKKDILQDIMEVELFENFLHVKFPGSKRFSVEGGASCIASLETLIDEAVELGVDEIIMGMAHRGRLNVLTKVMGKPYVAMLSEFQGNSAFPKELKIAGDVKYHLGASSERIFPGGQKVHLSLTANPSHLEAVNPVVVGKVRAKQDQKNDITRSRVMGVLIHGDAAFSGQGVVAETLNFAELKGYYTGGTIHIIVNNQIGFTTSPVNSRSGRYPTEFAKIIQAPVFHVNGDDPEAVRKVSKIAAEFRQKFQKDIIIDVFCYRLYGHNEGDEPFFTQPIMYKRIGEHKTAATIYAEKLIAENSITESDYEQMKSAFKNSLDKALEESKEYKPQKADWLGGRWQGFANESTDFEVSEPTGVDLNKLKKIGMSLASYPQDFNINAKVARQLEAKKKMIETGEGIDWATAEALAFGSLLNQGIRVRLSGQDACRGTFSHRHSVFVDQITENRFVPLNNLSETQAKYEVIDSNLSEFGVLGFEYGYSQAEPNGLILWEAQFGDFANGAQVIIDQYITSAETKWLRLSGLVMLLPHGYEGQGPEHSSARLERFLQQCAEDNVQVANCSTPASYYHILRRQICRNYRKPLILMTPKSLLRHRLAISSLSQMSEGTKFDLIISEQSKLVSDDKIRKVVICSGKVYYDLFEEREKSQIQDVAIIRMEQYYPFPAKALASQLKRYKNAEVIWFQEEPKNMGAWSFVNPRIEEVLVQLDISCKRAGYVGRPDAASPAVGYLKIHNIEQSEIVKQALSK
jgi:2-oxoglutarate dehydrogenase E1 component